MTNSIMQSARQLKNYFIILYIEKQSMQTSKVAQQSFYQNRFIDTIYLDYSKPQWVTLKIF